MVSFEMVLKHGAELLNRTTEHELQLILRVAIFFQKMPK